ncbi:hypothetical protein [Candidatus Binatus sp.]|uniref:hypothetical protein n=1 Tax=Candidatus Binatus sp. TaxID=2811406 RepID=UPI003CC6B59B
MSRVLLAAALILAISTNASADQVTSMKLLAPNVGWAESDGDLFWTTDGGAHWKAITAPIFDRGLNSVTLRFTPPVLDRKFNSISDTFFLDTHRGWVLLCCGPPPDPEFPYAEHQPLFTLAATADAGTTWSTAPVNIPKGAEGADMSAASTHWGLVAFADYLHGWLKLNARETPQSSWGPFLITSDGGRTWRSAPDPPGDDLPFTLVTPAEGWQIGAPSQDNNEHNDQNVYVTRDGAKSWHEVSLPTPKEILGLPDVLHLPANPAYYLPTFEDSRHGFLPVIYTAQEYGGKSAMVLFETADGGRSWKAARTVTNLELPGNVNLTGDPQLFAVADSTLLVVSGSNHYTHLTLSKDGPDGRIDADISNYMKPRDEGFALESQLSFATPKEGWMRNYAGLWSTTDGGTTWKNINPK